MPANWGPIPSCRKLWQELQFRAKVSLPVATVAESVAIFPLEDFELQPVRDNATTIKIPSERINSLFFILFMQRCSGKVKAKNGCLKGMPPVFYGGRFRVVAGEWRGLNGRE
jgi:hypothetical protein